MYSVMSDWPSTSRVSPFGYHGIYACLRLPHAFRSLPRPSSALGALASALCSCSLDFLENDLSIIVDPETNCLIIFSGKLLPISCNWSSKTFSRLSFYVRLSRCMRNLFRSGTNPENDTDLRKTVHSFFATLGCSFSNSFRCYRPMDEASSFDSAYSLERR